MRKTKRLLALLLTLCMVLSLIPMTAAFAETPGITVDRDGGEYTVTVVNDAPYAVKFNLSVTLKGARKASTQTVSVAANDSIVMELGVGDLYKVTVGASDDPYYKVADSSLSLWYTGSEEQAYPGTWEHTIGSKVDKKDDIISYHLDTEQGPLVDEADVTTVYANYKYNSVQKSTLKQWTASLASDKKTVTLTGKNGEETYTEQSKSTKRSDVTNAKTAVVAKAKNANPGYNAYDSVSVGGTSSKPSVSGTYTLGHPVVKVTEKQWYDCDEAKEIRLTFTSEFSERVGSVSLTAYNMDAVDYANNNGGVVKSLAKILSMEALPDFTICLDRIPDGADFEVTHFELSKAASIFDSYAKYLPGLDFNIVSKSYTCDNVPVGDYMLSVIEPKTGYVMRESLPLTVHVSENKTVKAGEAGPKLYLMWLIKDIELDTVGLHFDYVPNHMEFTNVNVGNTGIGGASFVMINRDQLIENSTFLLNLGKETLDAIIGGISYENLAALLEQLKSGSEVIPADGNTAQQLLTTIAELFKSGKLTGIQAPAVLEAKADSNGIVRFTENSNVTVSALVNLIPDALDRLYRLDALGLIPAQLRVDTDKLREMGANLGGTELSFATLRALGLVDSKFPTGNYVMYQKTAPDGTYFRNVALYTVNNSWDGAGYANYAQLGVIGPLFQSQFKSFLENLVANSGFESKLPEGMEALRERRLAARELYFEKLNELAIRGDEFNSWIRGFTESNSLRAVLLAYAGQFVYANDPGAYESVEAAIDAVEASLSSNFTYEELLADVSEMLSHIGNPFGGCVDVNWYFYNISKNIFTNSFGAFDYALRVLMADEDVDKLEEPFKEGADKLIEGTDELIVKTEAEIDRISTEIEEKNEEIREQIGEQIREQISDLIEDMTKPDEQAPEEAPVEDVVEAVVE